MSHLKKALFLIPTMALAAALLTPSLVLASGISSSGGDSFSESDPMLVTEKIKCVVIAVEEDGTLLVEDESGRHRIAYDEDLKVVAQDKRQFDGRKRLTMEDIEVGHKIKVTLRPAAQQIVSIQVLRERAEAPTAG